MDWLAIGARIRRQREYLGYTREQLAEYLDVTPKFCSDIELGAKGMSIPTLCKIFKILRLKTDYIFPRQKKMLLQRMIPYPDFPAIINHIKAEKVSRQLTFLCYNGAIVGSGGVICCEINR